MFPLTLPMLLEDSVAEFNPQRLIGEVIPTRKEIKTVIINPTQGLLPFFEQVNFSVLKAGS
jgi:hypothetical protein